MDQKQEKEADNKAATVSNNAAENEAKPKKLRKRMKDQRKKIKAQMEFYFSDSNLQKDRFLKKEIEKSEDRYVDIEMFLNFNKIKQLTEDAKVIARSLKKSNLLEVNQDERKVRRCVPVQSLPHVDDRTVYVEHLPRNIDHEWVKTLFSQCGEVLYVSLPRFKSTGDLKGFGFVEFRAPEEATKACEMLNNPPPMSAKGCRFPKWNKMLYQLAKKTEHDGPENMDETQEKTVNTVTPKETVEEPVQKPCKKHKRRRRRTSESSVDGSTDTVPHKRRKTDSIDTTEDESCKDSVPHRRRKTDSLDSSETDVKEDSKDTVSHKRRKTDSDTTEDDGKGGSKESGKEATPKEQGDSKVKRRKNDSENTEDDGKGGCKESGKETTPKEQCESVSDGLRSEEEASREGKKKKRTKRQRLSDSNKEEESEQTDSSVAEKTERKRKRMSDSRESGDFSAPQAKMTKTDNETENATSSGKKKRRRKKKKKNKEKDVPPPQLKVITKQEWLKLRQEYLSQQKSNMAALKQTLKQQAQENEARQMEEEKKAAGARRTIDFVPGVIVEVNCQNPMNRRSLKEKLPSDATVAYFDIKDDSTSGHIRCQDNQSAKKISDFLLDNFTFSLLAGEGEKQYWDKLVSDRETKFSTKNRTKKRGAQKLIEKVHKHNTEVMEKKKHIVFED